MPSGGETLGGFAQGLKSSRPKSKQDFQPLSERDSCMASTEPSRASLTCLRHPTLFILYCLSTPYLNFSFLLSLRAGQKSCLPKDVSSLMCGRECLRQDARMELRSSGSELHYCTPQEMSALLCMQKESRSSRRGMLQISKEF